MKPLSKNVLYFIHKDQTCIAGTFSLACSVTSLPCRTILLEKKSVTSLTLVCLFILYPAIFKSIGYESLQVVVDGEFVMPNGTHEETVARLIELLEPETQAGPSQIQGYQP